MKSAEVIRRLRSEGWELHHAKGSHPKRDLPAGKPCRPFFFRHSVTPDIYYPNSSYRLEVDAVTDGKASKERMVAKRIGDCPK